MAKKFFLIYIFFSIGLSVISVTTNVLPVPYGYNKIFTLKDILPYILSILVGIIFFYFGYHSILNDRKKPSGGLEIFPKKKLVFDDQTTILFFVIQILLMAYFLYISYEGTRQVEVYAYELYRPTSSKASIPILFLQAVLPLILSRQRIFFVFSVACCVFISILISWIDASRSAVIALVGVIYVLFSNKRFVILVLALFHAVNCYALSLVARSINSRFSFEGLIYLLEQTLDNYLNILVSIISYTSAFSVLHFSFVLDSKINTFVFSDLVYSILPIPSFLWPGEIPDYSNWRIDYYRPMGALAEVATYSKNVMYFLFFVYGLIAKFVDTMSDNLLKIGATIVFVATIIILFQYNMRTLMWFLYLLVFIKIIDAGFFKKVKFRSS